MTDICALLNEMERDVLPLTFFLCVFFSLGWGGGGGVSIMVKRLDMQ